VEAKAVHQSKKIYTSLVAQLK